MDRGNAVQRLRPTATKGRMRYRRNDSCRILRHQDRQATMHTPRLQHRTDGGQGRALRSSIHTQPKSFIIRESVTMEQGKYIAKNGDEEAQERIEGIKVFCPHCGEEANLIWSVANGYHHASWHCPCQASEKDLWKGWGTTDPEPFREKQQRFKNLFDF